MKKIQFFLEKSFKMQFKQYFNGINTLHLGMA